MKIHGTCKIYTRKEMDVDPDRGTKFARFVCCIKNADPEIAVAWKKVLRCDAFCTSLVDACTLPGGSSRPWDGGKKNTAGMLLFVSIHGLEYLVV